ncbi:MAG: DNA polymerase III subunit alpha [Candidatus Kerfeldbacteria bacterium]
MSFIHLHVHSHYSLLDGVPKIPELIHAVKKAGMPAVALTDHGNMYGAIEFFQEAKKNGIKPIIGMEVYIAPNGVKEMQPRVRPYHLVLLAKNRTGYENLIQLTSYAHLEGYYSKPRVDIDILRQHADGLIALTACLSGEVPKTFLTGGYDKAKEAALKYSQIFPENLYLEVQYNPSMPEQELVNQAMLQMHQELGLPLVATNDVHYIAPEDNEAQDVLLCIQTKKLLTDTERLTMMNEDYSLTPASRMQELFAKFPGAIENTLKIADEINIEIQLGKIQIPHFDLPENVTPEQRLRDLCNEGIQNKYKERTTEISERLDYELDIIERTGFASYFLIVQDFINWAKKQKIAVGPGRGSAAGSIVAYLTNITDIDPIKYELLFERFLNPERISMPDIDTDFADARRDDVLRYVEQRYGKDHVAQIITFGTLGAKAAVRDVGRVMGLSYGYCDRISKLIPMFMTLQEALESVSELSDLINEDADAERLIQIAQKLEGVARHTSTHACAVVITKEPLTKTVPLQVDPDDKGIITQYPMNPIEALGLLKMDFLGLKNLTIIEDTLNIVDATTGRSLNIEEIPLNNKPTFKLLQQANTIGVFQLESSGMRRYLKQLKPTEMEDIIAMVSLYRPGPMDFIPDYISGKHGKRTITYLEKRLQPILEKTYGIAVYQEQIMEIARQLAGFSYGEADVLRKAVGKKNKALLDKQEQKMIQGMVDSGISHDIAKRIWEFILPFARYGFNRSHAACYAMIAYRTAFLKANYPAQFMAALLNADHGNTERVALEINHALSMGIKVLPPDINESFASFTVVRASLEEETQRIRFGLKAIKNVGDNIVTVIIKERKENGPFATLEDFLRRVQDKDLNKKSLESLIKTGALDSLGERNKLLLNIEVLLQYAKQAQNESISGQGNLFGGLKKESQPGLTLSEVPEISEKIRLSWEKELLGLYISGHPLSHISHVLEKNSIPFSTLKNFPKRQTISVIGIVTTVKRVTTKNGEAMLFVGFADNTAEIEIIIFPKTYQKYSTFWDEDAVLEVKGKLDDKDGALKILVEEVKRFDPDNVSPAPHVRISVPKKIKKSLFKQFSELIKEESQSEQALYAVYLIVDGKTIDTNAKIPKKTIKEIEQLFGQQAVSVVE